MKFKIKGSIILKRIFVVIGILLISGYFIFAGLLMSNRTTGPIENTKWISKANNTITFIDSNNGLATINNEQTLFNYKADDGYIICRTEEELFLELIHIQGDRLLSVKDRIMYYNEATL